MSIIIEDQNGSPVLQSKEELSIWSKTSLWCSDIYRLFLAEVLATTLLLFFGCASCLPIPGFETLPAMYAAFGFGFTVMLNILIFGHISGAHMNPVVTIAAFIWGSLPFATAIAYIIAQAAGATLGYYIVTLIAPIDAAAAGVCMTLPQNNLTDVQAFGIEVVLTSGLILLCCGLWDPVNKDKVETTAIKFGLTIVGLSLSGGPLTGASMNPMRSLGPAIFSGQWRSHWVYWVGPITGGIVPTLLYKYLWLTKEVPRTVENIPLK